MATYYKHHSTIRPIDEFGPWAVVPAPGHCGHRVKIVSLYADFKSAMTALRRRNDLCVVSVSGYRRGDDIGPWQSHDRLAENG